MNQRHGFSFLAFIVVVILSAPAVAHAQSLYAGVLGGYAGTTSDNPSGVEAYGVGLGASAGLTLPVMPIYLGARIVRFLGESTTTNPTFTSGSTTTALSGKVDSHYLLYGIDLGYDAELGPLVLRPALGIGRAIIDTSVDIAGVSISASDASAYFAPSIGLIIKAGLLYVGGELRYNALTESNHPDSTSLLASVGLTL